jgi:hypothetical protein
MRVKEFFDTEFKQLIAKIKEEQWKLIIMMESDDIEILIENQNILRQIIKTYPFKLNTKKQLEMPEYYAIIACLITDLENYICWENFKLNKKEEYFNNIICEDVRDISENTYCSCGHSINYAFKIWTNTNRNMITGSECFKKEELFDCDTLNKIQQQFVKNQLKKRKEQEKDNLLILNRVQIISNINIIHKFNQITKDKAFEIEQEYIKQKIIKQKEQQRIIIEKQIERQWIIDNDKYILIRMHIHNFADIVLKKYKWNFDKVIDLYC